MSSSTLAKLWKGSAKMGETHSLYEKQDIFKEPVCLIETENSGKLKVVPDVLAQIKKIDAPVVVIAIVGLYRTGKSYLMNRLAGVSSGFALGKTIESKTKGIWAWCKIHPEKANTVLLLLDTEGLGDVKKGNVSHDNCIFALAALLSNVLVYNVMTAFNQDANRMDTIWKELSKTNLEMVKNHCAKVLEDIYKKNVGENLEKYNKPDGYFQYRADMGNVRSEYLRKMNNVDETSVHSILNEFSTREKEKEDRIMMIDRKLSAADRQREIERFQKETAQAYKKQQDEFQLQLKQEREYRKKLEEDRKAHEEMEYAKMEKIMNDWKEKNEYSNKQMQAMLDNNQELLRKLENEKQEREKLQKKLEQQSSCSIN